jgi:hypothetical protein
MTAQLRNRSINMAVCCGVQRHSHKSITYISSRKKYKFAVISSHTRTTTTTTTMSGASSPSSLSPIHEDSTNTLVLTGLPREFFHSEVLEPLRHLFASYGEINQWVPLRSMVRVIIVYLYDEDAMCAKAGYEGLVNNDLSDR